MGGVIPSKIKYNQTNLAVEHGYTLCLGISKRNETHDSGNHCAIISESTEESEYD